MAKSLTARFGLQRWSADADTQARSEFDNDNAQLEAKAAMFGQGTLAAKGAASAANAGTFWTITDAAGGGVLNDLWYSTGAAWIHVGTASFVRGTVALTVATSAPGSPAVGDIWVDSS